MRRFISPRLILIVMTVMTLMSIAPVSAHGYLIRSIPQDRATLERAPTRLQYWFSEALEAQFSSLTVLDQGGKVVASGGVSEDNNTLLTARLPNDLGDGAYIVDMRIAFASDGHVIAERRVFFVGEANPNIQSGGTTYSANGFEIVWRTMLLTSSTLLLGTFIVYGSVLVPAWGNPAYRAGLLPPRVMTRLNWMVGAALAVALVGNLLALAQQSMVFFDAPIEQVISQQLWRVVREGSRFGDLWTARMILLVIVGVCYGLSLYLREDQPESVRGFWTANAWAMALVMGSFSAGSHAAGSPILPWVAIFNDWLHVLCVGAWAGGVSAMALVLPSALTPYSGEARRLAQLAALKRFSRIATACVVVVIATGIYSSATWIYSSSDATDTAFGDTLLLKVVLVGGLVVMGLAHHISLQPERYERWVKRVGVIRQFVPTLRLEAILVLLVLGSVGVLSATPVPVPYFIQEAVPSPTATLTSAGYSITQTVTPGGPGVNTYDTQILRDGRPVEGLTVRLQLVQPERDKRSLWLSAEDAGNGVYIAAGGEIDRAGSWLTLVDLQEGEGGRERVVFEWAITDEARVEQTQAPRLQHFVAIGLVLAAVGWALYPTAQGIYRRLDLSTANVTVAIGTIIATIGLSAAGVVVIQNTQAEYEATLNPLPTIINPILPDADSLRRGEDLLKQYCPDWVSASLIDRLPRTRDEDLFTATEDGWQGFADCDGKILTDLERWDLVNYIRTFQK